MSGIPSFRLTSDGGQWSLSRGADIEPAALTTQKKSRLQHVWTPEIQSFIRQECLRYGCGNGDFASNVPDTEKILLDDTLKKDVNVSKKCATIPFESKESDLMKEAFNPPRPKMILDEYDAIKLNGMQDVQGFAFPTRVAGKVSSPCATLDNGGPALFQTGSGKSVQISSQAMLNAKLLLRDAVSSKENTPNLENCEGDLCFSPRTRPRNYSAEALKNQNCQPPLFKTAAGKCVSVSDAAMKRALSLLGGIESTEKDEKVVDPLPADVKFTKLSNHSSDQLCDLAFQTAAGRPVSVSKAKMKQAEELLADEGKISFVEKPRPKLSPLNDASCMQNHTDAPNFPPEKTPVVSFSTASGRSVTVSNSAMRRAISLLDGENKNNLVKDVPAEAWHKSVSASSKPLLLNDASYMQNHTDAPNFPPEKTPVLSFSTASGRSVTVSNSAMRRAISLLDGENKNNLVKDVPAEAQHKSVSGSSNAELVLETKKFLFETATGRPLSVSDSSLQRAMNLFSADNVVNGLEVSCYDNGLSNNSIERAALHQKEVKCRVNLSSAGLWDGKKSTSAVVSEDNFQKSNDAEHAKSLPDSYQILKRRNTMKSALCFKKPRRVRFVTPQRTIFKGPEVMMPKKEVSQAVELHSLHPKRSSMKEYLRLAPHSETGVSRLPREIVLMTPGTAKHFRFIRSFTCGQEKNSVGQSELHSMLLQAGAKSKHATEAWVENHYKWIVWKLSCLERSYPQTLGGKLLNIEKVFDELKYRYEREFNCGHRSALKKITEGDAAAGQMMVVCVSAIHALGNEKAHQSNVQKLIEMEQSVSEQNSSMINSETLNNQGNARIEVTDGWYSLAAVLDLPLSKQVAKGNIFVGQKLRVWGAALLGCPGPMPPLEAYEMGKLFLHINGTHRTHWAESLGFCKYRPRPLAFQSIADNGGIVPRTLIGVTRVYPILFYERLSDGSSITRSAKAEEAALYLYNDRRARIAEEVVLKFDEESSQSLGAMDNDMDEGARLYKLLENAAEPEVLMADMTAAQLAAFAAHQSKRKVSRQTLIERRVQKALEEFQLVKRNVSSFLRVRVTGLNEAVSSSSGLSCIQRKISTREGLLTVWQPTERQGDIKEGDVYCISHVRPVCSKSVDSRNGNLLHIHTTKNTCWHNLQGTMKEKFQFSFSPRSALPISSIGTIPLRSEFDVATLVIYVGEPYLFGLVQKQWIFVSDGSLEEEDNSSLVSLLAIENSAVQAAFLPVDAALTDSVVGFINLVKRDRDESNALWVGEAIEYSVCSSNFDHQNFHHLRAAKELVTQWSGLSKPLIQALKNRVEDIVTTKFKAL